VTFSGLASGLNTQQIIQAELAPEVAIIQSYQAQEATLTSKQTAWQGIASDLQALLTQTQALLAPQAFQAMAATSSAPGVLTAAAQPGAPAGSYSLTVTRLAQAQQSVSSGSASDPNALVFGTGTITIQVGSQAPVAVSIGSGHNSLNGIAAAINQANAGVTASVINTGSSYKLLLSGNSTGAANSFTVTDGLSGGSVVLGPFSNIQAAQDASITFGSGTGAITVTSPSNTVTSLVPGVTLTLVGVGSAVVTVAPDTSALAALVQNWVSAYNQVQKDLNTQNSYNTTTQQPGGPLFGDPLLDTIWRTLARAVSGTVSGAPTSMNSLGMVGITMNSDGTLSVNTTTLASQLVANPQGVGQLMQGIANALEPGLGALAAPVTGAVPQAISTLGTESQSVQQTVTALQQQLSQEQQILQQEFIAMEQAVSRFQGEGQLLTAFVLQSLGTGATGTGTPGLAPTVPAG
jgi:flagellar hook-associated protein 2